MLGRMRSGLVGGEGSFRWWLSRGCQCHPSMILGHPSWRGYEDLLAGRILVCVGIILGIQKVEEGGEDHLSREKKTSCESGSTRNNIYPLGDATTPHKAMHKPPRLLI